MVLYASRKRESVFFCKGADNYVTVIFQKFSLFPSNSNSGPIHSIGSDGNSSESSISDSDRKLSNFGKR